MATDKSYNFVDVGANIGSVSLHLANIYKKSKIYAIEPSIFTFEKLKSNLSINKTLKKRETVQLINFKLNKKNNFSYASWKLNFDIKSHPIHKGILKKTTKTKSSLNKFLKKLKS